MTRRLLCAIVVASFLNVANAQTEQVRTTPIPAAENDALLAAKHGKATAVFAGGCFWGTQAVFERVKIHRRAICGGPKWMPRNFSHSRMSRG